MACTASDFAHVDNHPGDLGTEHARGGARRDRRDLLRRGGAPDRRGAPCARRRYLRHLPGLPPADPARAPQRRARGRALPELPAAASRACTGSTRTTSELAATLVTGATGLHRVARRPAARRARRRRPARAWRRARPTRAIADLDCRRVKLEVRDRRSVRRALRGRRARVPLRGRHVRAAGRRRARSFDVNVGGTKLVMEECLRAEVERVVYTSSAAAVGPAADGKAATETQLFTAARLGIPYVNSVHEAEVEAMRVAAHGLPLVCVNPSIVPRRGRPPAVLHAAGAQLPAGPDPGLHGRRGRDRRRARRGGGPPARRRCAARWASATSSAGRNFTFERLFADLGRLSGVPTPVRIPPRAAAAAAARARRGAAARGRSRRPRCARPGSGWTYRSTKAQRALGWRARPHEETLEATVAWHLEREHDRIARTRRSQQLQYRRRRGAAARRRRAGGSGGRAPPARVGPLRASASRRIL